MNDIFDEIKNMKRVSFYNNKMSMRNKFLENEFQRVFQILDECFVKINEIKINNDKKLIKIIDLIEELSEKSRNLEQVLSGKD